MEGRSVTKTTGQFVKANILTLSFKVVVLNCVCAVDSFVSEIKQYAGTLRLSLTKH